MTVAHHIRPGQGSQVVADSDGDVLTGTAQGDAFIGHHGEDIFLFNRGDGHDIITNFEQGVDHLKVVASIKTIALFDDPLQGTTVTYGSLGHRGPDSPDSFLVYGVHHLTPHDFIFV